MIKNENKIDITVPVRSIIDDKNIHLNELFLNIKKTTNNNTLKEKVNYEKDIEKIRIKSNNDSFSFIPIQLKNKTILNINTELNYLLLKSNNLQKKENHHEYLKHFQVHDDNEKIDIINHDQDYFSYDTESFHVIFTNRFFTYLNDNDVINFFSSCLTWIKEDGFLIINEPCIPLISEITSVENYLLPQKYSRSALNYINTIESIRIIDKFGNVWKFYIDVLTSNQTYINYEKEWRYLMLRAKKCRTNLNNIEVSKINSVKHLLEKLTIHVPLPNYCYQYACKSFADNIFLNEIENYNNIFKNQKNSEELKFAYFIFQNPKTVWYNRICPFRISAKNDTVIWCSESSSDFYEYSINKANYFKNKKMLFTYNNSHPIDALNAPSQTNFVLKVFMSIDILNNYTLGFNHFINTHYFHTSRIILLESYKTKEEKNEKIKKVWEFVKKYKIKNVTKMVHNEVKDTSLPDLWKTKIYLLKWMIIIMDSQDF
ncbi:Protein of unknown function DUF858,methyltransferase-like family-containing protein [Strongyloides ratti]|uniref:phosphoethanolamine N-methyltransferase n=1 Tax=Strongyloides ratti TaxID=34506 RepID=A0A090KW90_STRRB|nr:Protein of unknown function DUF858,methyltransferase-like family-containing protein [Strongyloides ratti]CEF59537.1 Protein of unknown function DUF858,methyltransferase-like family-containing protein [Strongyloides ratti]